MCQRWVFWQDTKKKKKKETKKFTFESVCRIAFFFLCFLSHYHFSPVYQRQKDALETWCSAGNGGLCLLKNLSENHSIIEVTSFFPLLSLWGQHLSWDHRDIISKTQNFTPNLYSTSAKTIRIGLFLCLQTRGEIFHLQLLAGTQDQYTDLP